MFCILPIAATYGCKSFPLAEKKEKQTFLLSFLLLHCFVLFSSVCPETIILKLCCCFCFIPSVGRAGVQRVVAAAVAFVVVASQKLP